MLIQQSYSMADLLIVSYFADEASVAAVNNGGQVTFFAVAIAIGLSIGGTILVGQYYGAKQMEDVTKTIATVMTMMLAASLILGVFLLALGSQILRVLQIPSESYAPALVYLRICMIGLPFVFIYNSVSGILRGMGDSKRPLIIVAISCGANIIINFILVGYFQMGAPGAAIGTVVSQIGTVVASGIYLSKRGFAFDFKPKSFVIYKDKLRLILKLGIPSGISQIAVNLSFLLLTTLLNSYGVYVAAAAGLAGRLNGFVIMPIMAIQNSIAMICAQNLGALKQDRALRTMLVGIVLSFAIGIPCFFIVRYFPDVLMRLMSNSPPVIEAGSIYMRVYAWDYVFVPLVFSFFGLATGAGHTHITMINTFMTSIGIRIPAALFFSRYLDMGLEGVALSVPVATAGSLIYLTYYVLRGRWRTAVVHKVMENE